MKNIKELELLVNFAKSLGQTPDPEMVAQIREHYEFQKKIVESVKANSAKDLNEAFGLEIIKEPINELVQTPPLEEKPTEEIISDTPVTAESFAEQSLAERAAKLIKEAPKKDSYQQPDIPLTDSSMKAVQDKLKFLEQWLSKVSLAGPGGGAVNLRDLDDVSKYSISHATEHQYLTYNAQSKLWIATNHTNNDIKLDDLVDVIITAPTNGQVLKYDSIANAWVAAADIALTNNGAPVISFSDLTIVTLSPTATGGLQYNSNTGVFSHAPSYGDRLISGNAVVIMDSTNNFSNLGNLIPLVTNVYTLGTPTNKWKELYVGPGSINIEDQVTHTNGNLTLVSGVLFINGVNQLQVGQLKFANNTIQSTTSNIDIQFGYLTDTANLVINRDLVVGQNRTIRFADNTTQRTAFTSSAVNAYVIPMLTTANVIESSSNLYFTSTRVVSTVTPLLTTANTIELNNLYYTNSRVISAVTPLLTSANVVNFSTTVNTIVRPILTTANVIETSGNLYFTNARVVSALSTDSTLTLYANGQIASNTLPSQLMSYGQFWDTTTQVCNANTATLMRFNRADGHLGVNLANANTRVILQNTGTYNLQFSSQFVNTTNSPENTWIWFRQANVDLADSAGLVAVPKKDGAVNGAIIVSWNTFVTTTVPNDYVELVWFTVDEVNNQMTYYPAANAVVGTSPPIPAIPSVILTVEQIR